LLLHCSTAGIPARVRGSRSRRVASSSVLPHGDALRFHASRARTHAVRQIVSDRT